MKRYFFLIGAISIAGFGCKKDGKVSNAATDYTSALQDNVQKAKTAAEKANQAIAAGQSAIDQAQEQAK